ncbi:DUF924 domain-containing protein [Bradyrhizobium daqingense]|uniref:Uncharacterized protein (DUF924 family) n=1 Tax=Bradyrhizobium daqingense TaxID=993502 RepID=A0A562KPQ2_9BRAD|nr:DUF924 family protein [Bradyrhizobium daqingense]TWH97409.1 uncharacterized protein (DUF924 family) [Bradyrhizobium daqingense]UFS90818.1 DUF924 domain-containing protein [Bradyrhizobium daqingense]
MLESGDITPSGILAFWREAGRERWYKRDDAFDAEIRRRFLALWQKAAAGELASWETSDEGALALVIVLDQFPRNMFRGTPQAFASDVQARDVARRAIARGVDRRVDPILFEFLYLPFMHSEHLADQLHCVALFENTDNVENLKYAREHADIIERFGRFPHRNNVLGRDSTEAEQAFLDGGGFAG